MSLPTSVGVKRMAAKLAEIRKAAEAAAKDGGEFAHARALGALLADISGLEIALTHWNGAFFGEEPPAFAALRTAAVSK